MTVLLPVRHCTRAWMRNPVASVPISESILNTTTTTPFMTPTSSATTMAITMPSHTGASLFTMA